MQEEFLFAGFGGQGVMFVGQLLAYAAMDQGLAVTWIPSYGPEMRGGTANCITVVSDETIASPVVTRPSVVVVFNGPSFAKYEPKVAPGGVLVRNSTLVEQASNRTDIREIAVPATTLADELGTTKAANMILLGAALAARPVLLFDAIRNALQIHLPARHLDLLPINLSALDCGAAYGTPTPPNGRSRHRSYR